MDKKYKVVEGTAFHIETPREVCRILNDAIKSNQKGRGERLRMYFGDIATGECWMDEYDTIGYIGRSTGIYKVPLLIKTKRSYGGVSILDHCIIRIDSVSQHMTTLYKHPNFHFKKVSVKDGNVFIDDGLYASFSSDEKAHNLAAFLLGKRNKAS